MAELSDDPTPYPKPHPAFNPGGGDPGVIRMIDGHDPYSGGIEGANVHHRGEGVGEPVGLPVEDVD